MDQVCPPDLARASPVESTAVPHPQYSVTAVGGRAALGEQRASEGRDLGTS
ncbi:hypothetical protein [Pseudoclavibacter sp. VKM Ac-2867]|uniref:hypothetical protein n=1 Tax=Pseudoclavibacter sp. VKM Ac-2867 TaxID=2783829 RepID=UPI00188BC083|nr:hypothetical protein [Pseudoclavibacter sp. VKM Ac-2867]MBF4459945.1 hypothetical protein [Pseudoclavibacter sp. VKM Ac-2867]